MGFCGRTLHQVSIRFDEMGIFVKQSEYSVVRLVRIYRLLSSNNGDDKSTRDLCGWFLDCSILSVVLLCLLKYTTLTSGDQGVNEAIC